MELESSKEGTENVWRCNSPKFSKCDENYTCIDSRSLPNPKGKKHEEAHNKSHYNQIAQNSNKQKNLESNQWGMGSTLLSEEQETHDSIFSSEKNSSNKNRRAAVFK